MLDCSYLQEGNIQSLVSQFFRSLLSIVNAGIDNFVVEDEVEYSSGASGKSVLSRQALHASDATF